MSRNNYIQNKSLRTFFIASVLISLVAQINTLIDGVIVSHFVSPDAVSVISLAAPILSVLYMFAGMVSMGATVLVTKEIGMQNYPEVSRFFVSGILIAVAVTALMASGLIAFSDSIAGLLTKEERLLPHLQDYLPVVFIGSIVSAAATMAMVFTKSSGHPEMVTRAVIVMSISNIALDLLFVGAFSTGIKGAAWASALGILFAFIILMRYLFRKDSLINWTRPERAWFFSYGRDMTINGIPSAVGSIATAVLFAALNMIVQKSQGADGMFILSVSVQMLMLCMLVLGGAAGSITGIGGVMLGEGDADGYRSLVGGVLKKSAIALSAISAMLMIYPDLLAGLFGADDDLLLIARGPLRAICFAFIPLGVITIMDSSFLLQGHKALSSFLSSLYVICLIPAVWAASIFCPQYLWHSVPAGAWTMFLFMTLCSFAISRKKKDLHWFTLISKYPNDPSISLSVNYDLTSAQEALKRTHSFLDICELDQSLYYKVDSCLDELAGNLISMTENTGKQGSFDLRVVDTGKKILITMKDDGKPYNPIIRYDATNGANPEDANLALVILNAFCPDLNYKYMNGINCVYMNFPYDK
ncbi:MAG: ATP-binding protein [Bacteroidales bacterium]|nr:ATP-binding protein [Bacteroidales bacterium]